MEKIKTKHLTLGPLLFYIYGDYSYNTDRLKECGFLIEVFDSDIISYQCRGLWGCPHIIGTMYDASEPKQVEANWQRVKEGGLTIYPDLIRESGRLEFLVLRGETLDLPHFEQMVLSTAVREVGHSR